MSIDEIDNLLNKRSGMLGLTGMTDMRDIEARYDAGDEDAVLAFKVYHRRITKYIGAYMALLGKVDAITFTAGIGENASTTRAMVIEPLAEAFGIKLDEAKNAERSKEDRIISTDDSTVKVCVIPTNEELSMARQTLRVVRGQ